jgi:hypothetical protein
VVVTLPELAHVTSVARAPDFAFLVVRHRLTPFHEPLVSLLTLLEECCLLRAVHGIHDTVKQSLGVSASKYRRGLNRSRVRYPWCRVHSYLLSIWRSDKDSNLGVDTRPRLSISNRLPYQTRPPLHLLSSFYDAYHALRDLQTASGYLDYYCPDSCLCDGQPPLKSDTSPEYSP